MPLDVGILWIQVGFRFSSSIWIWLMHATNNTCVCWMKTAHTRVWLSSHALQRKNREYKSCFVAKFYRRLPRFTIGENAANARKHMYKLRSFKKKIRNNSASARCSGWLQSPKMRPNQVFFKTRRSCGEFTEGAWWEHSASIRSQSIIDGHVNILWGRAMEKMTLYSGTHT